MLSSSCPGYPQAETTNGMWSLSERASSVRTENQPAKPLRAAVAFEKELFISRVILYICVPSGTDIGVGKGLSTIICTDEYRNV